MNKSKSSLFLMELILVIMFFALTSAITISLFVGGQMMSQKAKEQEYAVTMVRSAVACYEKTADFDKTASYLGGTSDGDVVTVDYDENWMPVNTEGKYRLILEYRGGSSNDYMTLSQVKIAVFEVGNFEKALYQSDISAMGGK